MKLKFNTAACIAKIAASGKMSENDAKQLLQDVADRGEKMRVTGTPDPFVSAAGKLAERTLKDAQERSADALLNAGKRQQVMDRILAGKPEDLATNARSILVSENGAGQENVANFSGGLMRDWAGVLNTELKKAGLLKYSAKEEALSDISEAMFDMRQGAAAKSSAPAYEAARIIMRTMEAVRARLNGEGARIGEAIDYVFRTSHNKELMRSGGRGQPFATTSDQAFNQWWKTIYPLLNEEKTFEDLIPRAGETEAQARDRFGKAAFNAMYTGTRLGEETPNLGPSFEGTRNIGRRISQERTFYFKDGKSWAQYMKVYGQQLNALELAADTIYGGARAAGNMHFLGTNPGANMDLAIKKAMESLRNTNPDAVVKFQNDLQGNRLALKPALKDILYQVGALPQAPVHDLRHRILDSLLKVADMDTLGSVGITHATSLPTTFYLAGKGVGINSFESLGGLLKAMLPHSGDRTAALSEMGALADGLQAHNPYDNGVSIPGVISQMHSAFMTATGIRYVMRHAKSGFQWMVSNHLVNQSEKVFADLPAMLQQTMRAFGLDEKKWDLIRSTTKVEGPSGRKYIAPSAALDIPDSQITVATGLLDPKNIQHYRQETADQLMMMYSRMSDLSTVTPGPRERALLHGANRGADISSLFTQFSAWPLAATHQLIAKTIYESQSRSKAFWALGTAAGLSMLSGYLRMSVREMAAGRDPEIPQNAWQMGFLGLRAMMAGGVGGVLGDKIFGDIGQAARSGQVIGGPVISDVMALGVMAKKYLHSLNDGSKYNPWPDLTHFATQHVPFANLFYLKGAFDYGIFYHIFEWAQPGWWQRTNQARISRGQGAYAGYFPGAPIPYTPYGIGAR